jgi:hypothetical protein
VALQLFAPTACEFVTDTLKGSHAFRRAYVLYIPYLHVTPHLKHARDVLGSASNYNYLTQTPNTCRDSTFRRFGRKCAAERSELLTATLIVPSGRQWPKQHWPRNICFIACILRVEIENCVLQSSGRPPSCAHHSTAFMLASEPCQALSVKVFLGSYFQLSRLLNRPPTVQTPVSQISCMP